MSKLDGAVVFSKKYTVEFIKPVTRQGIEQRVTRLIQDIGGPLAHNGIILGHIKLLAKLPDEEFLFLSLTRLDQADVNMSAQWSNNSSDEWQSISLDINVLIFGHSREEIEGIVAGSLAILQQEYGENKG